MFRILLEMMLVCKSYKNKIWANQTQYIKDHPPKCPVTLYKADKVQNLKLTPKYNTNKLGKVQFLLKYKIKKIN